MTAGARFVSLLLVVVGLAVSFRAVEGLASGLWSSLLGETVVLLYVGMAVVAALLLGVVIGER